MTKTHAQEVETNGAGPEGNREPDPAHHRGGTLPGAPPLSPEMVSRRREDETATRIKLELLAFRGSVMTRMVRDIVAPSIWLASPRLGITTIMGALSIEGVRGHVIDEEMAEDRARALARLSVRGDS